jgi:hypothetical protein
MVRGRMGEGGEPCSGVCLATPPPHHCHPNTHTGSVVLYRTSPQCVGAGLCARVCSCPGPVTVSTAAFSALAVTVGVDYPVGMDCSVTVYSPDGGAVALIFTAFDTVAGFDCACLRSQG